MGGSMGAAGNASVRSLPGGAGTSGGDTVEPRASVAGDSVSKDPVAGGSVAAGASRLGRLGRDAAAGDLRSIGLRGASVFADLVSGAVASSGWRMLSGTGGGQLG
eukprot:IDg20703t1